MITVTTDFKDALKAPIKQVSGYLELEDGTQFLPGGILQKYTIDSVGGFLRTAMSKITVTLKGEQKYQGNQVSAFYGVQVDGDMEYVQKGVFTFSDVKYDKKKDVTVLIGYDNMVLFNADYVTVGNYPTTLFEYLQAITSLAGVPLENESIYNGEISVDEDFYMNVGVYSIREVLEDICEASASFAVITPSGNLQLRQITDTGDELDYSNLLSHELGDYWGGINAVVLSRQPQNDDVAVRNMPDINAPTTRNLLNLNAFNVGYKTED